jgi:predicted site-specific integrase-resolvase
VSEVVSPEEQFYSSVKVAQLFDVTVETVNNWIKRGLLEGAVKINGQWRIPRAAVLKLGNIQFGAP